MKIKKLEIKNDVFFFIKLYLNILNSLSKKYNNKMRQNDKINQKSKLSEETKILYSLE